MIPNLKDITVAYRCPHCGKHILSLVGVFALSGDLMKLKCDCGQSELTMERENGDKIRFSLPCYLCPKPHIYTLPLSMILGRTLYAFPCKYADLPIGFVGQKEAVIAAAKQADEQLLKIMEDHQIPDFSAFAAQYREEPDARDAQIEDLVRFTVRDLADEKKVYCNCPAHDGDYAVEFMVDSVLIYCRKCGATRMLPVTNDLTAQAFLSTDALDLRDTQAQG